MTTTATANNNSGDLFHAARITVIFLMLFTVAFLNVLICKRRGLRQWEKDKKDDKNNKMVSYCYDRYNDPSMQAPDRLVGNLLEWSPMFLGLLWSLAATNHLTSTGADRAAWIYVALRALFEALVLQHGVRSNGMQKHLWISTFPAYACLLFMAHVAVRELFFAK